MSWVCPNCSNTNEEENTYCFACGEDRPAASSTRGGESEPIKGKVVFSDADVIKESIKDFFGSFRRRPARPKKPKKEKPSREIREKKKPAKEKKVREKPSRAAKPTRAEKGFAAPWPEHTVVFDTDAMRSKGYARLERSEMNGIKGYMLYKADDTNRFIRVEMLVALQLAKKIS